ncbi:hypothetical protein [Gracilimonas halophila]|uniref:Uncharacterized protein n=1 Tax=Gracilimonas halophila TaxID=1834464 RepID=A0ABW5JJ43_9BACT
MPNDWLDKLMYYTFRSGTQKAFDEMQREMHEDIYHADIDRYKDVYDHLKKKKNISEKEREKALREIEAMIENAIKTKYTFSPFEHREAIEETWGFKEKRKAEAKRKKEKKVEVTFKDEFISNIYKMLEELSDIDDQNHTNEERIALEKTRETASLVVSILRDVYNGDKKHCKKVS